MGHQTSLAALLWLSLRSQQLQVSPENLDIDGVCNTLTPDNSFGATETGMKSWQEYLYIYIYIPRSFAALYKGARVL